MCSSDLSAPGGARDLVLQLFTGVDPAETDGVHLAPVGVARPRQHVVVVRDIEHVQREVLLVTCLDAREGDPNGRIVKVVMERARSDFQVRPVDTIGFKQTPLSEVSFEDCRVDADNVIAPDIGGTEILKESWNVNRPLVGLAAVHFAQSAFDLALEYARMRKVFGKIIAAHQLIQKNLSDVATSISASRLLCYQALGEQRLLDPIIRGMNAFIVTLASYIWVRGLVVAISGGRSAQDLDPDLRFIGIQQFLHVPLIAWIAILCFVVFSFIMSRTPFGRHITLVGGNAVAAFRAGIKVDRLMFVSFILAGAIAVQIGRAHV